MGHRGVVYAGEVEIIMLLISTQGDQQPYFTWLTVSKSSFSFSKLANVYEDWAHKKSLAATVLWWVH